MCDCGHAAVGEEFLGCECGAVWAFQGLGHDVSGGLLVGWLMTKVFFPGLFLLSLAPGWMRTVRKYFGGY